MTKCKCCEYRKWRDLMKQVAETSKVVTHRDSFGYKDHESMVNMRWIVNFIMENFKLK